MSELKHDWEVSAEEEGYISEVRPPISTTWVNRFFRNSRPSNQPIYSEQIIGYEIEDEVSYVSYGMPIKHGHPYQSYYCNESKTPSLVAGKPVVKSNISVFGDLSITDSKGKGFQKDICTPGEYLKHFISFR